MELEDIGFEEVRLLRKHISSLSSMLAECDQVIEAGEKGEGWEEQFLDATTLSRTRVDSSEVVPTVEEELCPMQNIWVTPSSIETHGVRLKEILESCTSSYEYLLKHAEYEGSNSQNALTLDNPQSDRNLNAFKDKHWLISSEEVGLFALFGGQGYYLLSELRTLYNDDTIPRVRSIISRISKALSDECSSILSPHWEFKYGFELENWLKDDRFAPDKWYLYSAPISYPLVMLLQMCRYLQTLHQLHTKHEYMLLKLKGATGHSQGVVSAVLLSMSKSETELVENMLKAAKYLLYQGLRCYEALVTCTSYKFNENEPYKYSPMLAVKGLEPKILKLIVATTVKRLEASQKERHKMNVSIINGPTLCVVSGQSNALLELQKTIAKFDAKTVPNKEKRLPKSRVSTSTAFLSVGAAFHSPINNGIVETVITDSEKVGFVPNSLSVPVYDSESGEDLRKQNSKSILRNLIEMQATKSFDFRNTLKHVSNDKAKVTHIFDFGPSDGTAKLCAGLKRDENILVIATGGGAAEYEVGKGSLVGFKSMMKEQYPVLKTSN